VDNGQSRASSQHFISAVQIPLRNSDRTLFWPTDLLLVILGPRWRRRYLWLRVAWLGVAALLWAAGVLMQPIGAALLIPLLPMALMLLYRPALPERGDLSANAPERAS